MSRVRRDVYQLPAGDTTLEWYAKAVTAMRARPSTDPTSWNFQAAIHGMDPANAFWTDAGTLPSASEQTEYWNQCQHGSWYFLPWHRMYLAYFEQIVARTIVDLGGPPGWALPFWNYCDTHNPERLNIPPAFTAGTPPTNPLQMPADSHGGPGRKKTSLQPQDTTLGALNVRRFTSSSSFALSGFGGPITRFSHDSSTFGAFEHLPHNAVHVDIGGAMGDPTTAGLDPIFWLHHANIDRLWQVWLDHDPVHRNPDDPQWLTYPFDFHDSSGAPATLTPADVLDTTRVLSGYVYQADAAHDRMLVPRPAAIPQAQRPDDAPEVVGASNVGIHLASGSQSIRIDFLPANRRRPSLHGLAAGAAVRQPPAGSSSATQAHLNFENVTGTGRPPVFDVYLDATSDQGKSIETYAGPLAFFGVAGASRPGAHHSGSGQHAVIDVSEQVHQMRNSEHWEGRGLSVRLQARDPADAGSGVTIGRISLYVR